MEEMTAREKEYERLQTLIQVVCDGCGFCGANRPEWPWACQGFPGVVPEKVQHVEPDLEDLPF
jgi:hypothetical protein